MAESSLGVIGHVSGKCPAIQSYWLLGDAGAVTLKGIFVCKDGRQVGPAVNTSIPLGDGTNNPVQIATSFPAVSDAQRVPVGFIGNLSGAARVAIYDATDSTTASGASAVSADFKSNYANYPLLAAGNGIVFGSVAVV